MCRTAQPAVIPLRTTTSRAGCPSHPIIWIPSPCSPFAPRLYRLISSSHALKIISCSPLSSACLLPVPPPLRTFRNPSPALRPPIGPGRRNESRSPEPATGAVSIASSVIAITRARIVRGGVGSAATVVPWNPPPFPMPIARSSG